MTSIFRILKKQFTKNNILKTIVILVICFLLYLYLEDKLEGVDGTGKVEGEAESETIEGEAETDESETIEGDTEPVEAQEAEPVKSVVVPSDGKLTNPNKMHQLQYADLVIANSLKISNLEKELEMQSKTVGISDEQSSYLNKLEKMIPKS